MLLGLLGLHAVVAVVAAAVARRAGARTFYLAAIAPAATVVWTATRAPGVLGGEPVRDRLAWVPSLGLELVLRLDAFSLLMVGLVSGIGVAVFLYSAAYFRGKDEKLGSFAGVLTAFAGSMLGLVLAEDLLAVFVFWELTSITSFLLIGYDDRASSAREAAQQALLTTGAGGLALLGGVLLIGQATGTTSMVGLAAADLSASPVLITGLVLVLLGAATKSAQVPFHTWLPGAMAAPTPVSAYLHSATMVKAGVYLVARLAPLFSTIGPWRPMVIVLGVATMLVGGLRALRQTDLKLVLAHGTVSQLGFLVVLFGVGSPEATFAGTVLLLAHALFKAALFLVVGTVDKATGTREVRQLDGLRRSSPLVVAAGTAAAASMAGLPPLFGFIAKESAYEALLHGTGGLGVIALVGVVVGSVLTFAYSGRFVAALWGHLADPRDGRIAAAPHKPASAGLMSPPVVLALLSLVLGVLPVLADEVVNAAALALEPAWHGVHLALWHGVNAALGLSLVTVAVGALLVGGRRHVERVLRAPAWMPSAQAGYRSTVHGTLAGASRVTALLQNGSLPNYLSIILLTAVALPAAALLGAPLPPVPAPASSGGQAVVALGTCAAAIAATAVSRRFAAVLLLGGVGYGVAVLFVLHGAPDLALTQLLIETLSVVVFVLVLRHLPDRFRPSTLPFSRTARAVVAGMVGTFVAVVGVVAASARRMPPVSIEHVRRALPEAEGRNVVNVILVDFRAFDTLGEIVVLSVAAMGVSALVIASRRDGAAASRRGGAGAGGAPADAPLDASGTAAEEVARP